MGLSSAALTALAESRPSTAVSALGRDVVVAVDGLIGGRLAREANAAVVADALCGGVLARSAAGPAVVEAVDGLCGTVLDRAMGVARVVAGSGGELGCAGVVACGADGFGGGVLLARAGTGVCVDVESAPLAFTSEVAVFETAAVAPVLIAGAFALFVAALGLSVSRSLDAGFEGTTLSRAAAVGRGVATFACCASVSGSNSISVAGGLERSGAVGLPILRKPGRIAGGGCVGGGTEGRCDTACNDG